MYGFQVESKSDFWDCSYLLHRVLPICRDTRLSESISILFFSVALQLHNTWTDKASMLNGVQFRVKRFSNSRSYLMKIQLPRLMKDESE